MAGVTFKKDAAGRPRGSWLAIVKVWDAPSSSFAHRQVSTGLPVSKPKSEAYALAAELQRQAEAVYPENRPSASPAFYRKQLDKLWKAAGINPPSIDTSWDEASALYIREAEDIADSTRAAYTSFKKNLATFLGPAASAPLRSVTFEVLQRFKDSFQDGRSPRTVRNQLKFVSSVFDRAIELGMVDKNPAKLVKVSAQSVTERRAFEPHELKALFGHLTEGKMKHWTFACLAALHNGFRLEDASTLKTSDFISHPDGRITVRITPGKKSKDPKTGKRRKPMDFPCTGELKALYLELAPDADPVTGRITPSIPAKSAASKAFAQILKDAKINVTRHGAEGGRQISDLSFHSFRRTSKTNMDHAGIHPRISDRINDHDDPDVAASYSDISLEAMENAVLKSAPKVL